MPLYGLPFLPVSPLYIPNKTLALESLSSLLLGVPISYASDLRAVLFTAATCLTMASPGYKKDQGREQMDAEVQPRECGHCCCGPWMGSIGAP